jgi:hypothetical protein
LPIAHGDRLVDLLDLCGVAGLYLLELRRAIFSSLLDPSPKSGFFLKLPFDHPGQRRRLLLRRL